MLISKLILEEINLARTKPAEYAEKILKYKKVYRNVEGKINDIKISFNPETKFRHDGLKTTGTTPFQHL